MREAVEVTDKKAPSKKYELGRFKQFAYVLKFNGNKKDLTSDFYDSFDEATFEANLFIEEKMKKNNKKFLKQLKEITFIKINAVGETEDGTFMFESEDIQTIRLTGFKK